MDNTNILNDEMDSQVLETEDKDTSNDDTCSVPENENISNDMCVESNINNNSAVIDNTQNQTDKPDEKNAIDITFANCTVSELYELAKEHPEENVAEDILSDAFRIFSEQRTGSAKEIYSLFLELKRSFEKSTKATATNANPARGLSGQENKRAYSGYAQAGVHRDVSSSLTGRQMQIARDSGMSYREYAELLASLPHGRNL